VRFREDISEEQARARATVQLAAALGRDFHRDYGVVLRGLLFAYDRHRAHRSQEP
jgi:hypothetical protein